MEGVTQAPPPAGFQPRPATVQHQQAVPAGKERGLCPRFFLTHCFWHGAQWPLCPSFSCPSAKSSHSFLLPTRTSDAHRPLCFLCLSLSSPTPLS